MFTVGLLVVLGLLIASVLVETEHYWFTLLYLAVCVGAWEFFGDSSILALIRTNPLQAIQLFFGYFVAGLVWSILKWALFLKRFKDYYEELRENFQRSLESTAETLRKSPASASREPPDTTYSKEKFRDWLRQRNLNPKYYDNLRDFTKPNPIQSAHRSTLIAWISYWPFSVLAFMFKEPVRLTYDVAKAAYQKLSSQILASTDLD